MCVRPADGSIPWQKPSHLIMNFVPTVEYHYAKPLTDAKLKTAPMVATQMVMLLRRACKYLDMQDVVHAALRGDYLAEKI